MSEFVTSMIGKGVSYAGWHRLWLIWFFLSFGSFLTFEIYALATDWRRTLSASIWAIEDFVPGQSISHWSAAHFLFIGVLALTFLWLLGHFALGWWR